MGIITVYLDNAATTMVDPEVLKEMAPFFLEKYAVASSQFSHSPGIEVKDELDKARKKIINSLGASSEEELVFTSGATESNNMALKGVPRAKKDKNHVIVSRIEHRSVLNSCQRMEKEGYNISYINVDSEGFIDTEQLNETIRNDTALVSIQLANEETGTIQDLKEIGKICNECDVLLHTDASQGFTKTPFDVEKYNVDLVSINAHLIHGPKGVGALYIKEGTPIEKYLDGGFNEFNLRAGTENVPGIIGFARACELAKEKHIKYMTKLRDYLIEGLLEKIPDTRLNGPGGEGRLCNNVNVSYRYAEGESILLHLDMSGIAVTTGSACFSRSLEPSYILKAMGLTHEMAHGSIRYSLSRYNTSEEMDKTITKSAEIVENLRKISPVGKKKDE